MATRDITFTIKDMDEDMMLATAQELGFTQGTDYTVTEEDVLSGLFTEDAGTVIPAQTMDEFYLGLFRRKFLVEFIKPNIVKAMTTTEKETLKALEETVAGAVTDTVVEVS